MDKDSHCYRRDSLLYNSLVRQKGVLILAFLVLVLDQVSKFLIQMNIPLWGKVSIIPDFFNLVHVLNRGAAFGFLNNSGSQWQILFFVGMSIIAVAFIIYLLLTTSRNNAFLSYGLAAVLGGALGNLVDRLRIGMVVDFLDLYVNQWHWPAFNLADAAITCGALSLIVSFYTQDKYASDSREHRSDYHI
ncbi:MAG TPA: signal peptidase II [Desulfohalobiaceae bacterium]|nr:signal peptidase II [Desulfohalobiaceae bacterium]